MVLAEAYSTSASEQQFYDRVRNKGLQLYFRGRVPGIKGEKRKYRLVTLGYSKERMALLTLEQPKRQQRLLRLAQLQQQKAQDLDLEQDY